MSLTSNQDHENKTTKHIKLYDNRQDVCKRLFLLAWDKIIKISPSRHLCRIGIQVQAFFNQQIDYKAQP